MTEKEALKIVKKAFPKYQFVRVTDYRNLYVFIIGGREGELQNPIAVEKDTGKTLVFHPLMNDPQAYVQAVKENSHELKDNNYDRKVKAGEDAIAHALKRGEKL